MSHDEKETVSIDQYKALRKKYNVLCSIIGKFTQGVKNICVPNSEVGFDYVVHSNIDIFFTKVAEAKAVWKLYKAQEPLPEKTRKQHEEIGRHWCRFLDVGCSIGTRVVMAEGMDFICAFGLEVDPDKGNCAKLIMKHKTGDRAERIFISDRQEFDKYQEFDVIYIKSIYEDKNREKFYKKLFNDIVPGTVVIADAGEMNLPDNVHEVGMNIFIKVSNDFTANNLKKLKQEYSEACITWGNDY